MHENISNDALRYVVNLSIDRSSYGKQEKSVNIIMYRVLHAPIG